MMKLNFQHMQYFIAVARTLNFTQAAQDLFVSQPALSKQIRQMEDSLGIQLFVRNTKNVGLTPGGKLLYENMQEILQKFDTVLIEAKNLNQKRRTVRLGIVDFGGVIEYTMPLIEAYAYMQPSVDFRYEVYSFNQLKQKFADGELDVIFTFSSETPTQKGCVTEVLRDLDLNIIVSLNNPICQRETLEVKDLKDQEFCVLSSTFSDCAADYIIQHCKMHGFVPQNIREYPNITSLYLAISQGKGLTLGYRVFFNQFQNDLRKVKFYRIMDAIENHKVVMTYRRDQEESLADILNYLRSTRESKYFEREVF